MKTPQTGRQAFGTLLRCEWKKLLSRPLYPVVMIVFPLFTLLLFTTLLHGGQPSAMPAGVVDMDGSATSRKITRTLDAFQHLNIVRKYATVAEAREAMQEGRIYGFFYFPEHFGSDVYAQRRPVLSYYVSYTYLVAASLLYQDMKTMAELAGASATLTTLTARGATKDQAMGFVQPISIDKHPLHNPWLNYSVYLTNTIVPGLLSLLIFLLTAFSVSSEVKYGTAHTLMRVGKGSVVRVLLAKLLPQTVVWCVVGGLCQAVLYGWLHFPLESGWLPMATAMVLLVLASQAVGVFFFGVVPQVRFCMAMCSLWGVVSVSISGFTFPVPAMYAPLQALANLFPLRHYFLIYCDQALNGLSLSASWSTYLALAAFLLLPLTVLPRIKHSYLYDQYMP